MFPEIFPRMHIRDMYFHDRCFDGCYCIPDRHRSMRIPAWVKDDTIMIETDSLQFVDQFSFYVALKIIYRNAGIFLFQRIEELLESSIAIDIRFSFTD